MPRAAVFALFIGQMMTASSAAAMCQNVQCMLPGDLILSRPLDFAKDPGSVVEQADRLRAGAESTSSAEGFVNMTGNRTDRFDSVDEAGYSSRSLGAQLGGLREVAGDTFFAYSLAYEDTRQHANDGLSRTDSRLYYAGLGLERHWGGWRTNGAIGFGHARHRMRRGMADRGDAAMGHSRFGSYYGVLGSGVSYRFEGAEWYLEPGLSVALVYEYTPGYREHGLGGQNQYVRRDESLKALLAPALEVGRRARLGPAQALYWFSAGVNLLPDNTWKTRSRAEGEPGVEVTEAATMPIAIGDLRIGVALAGSGRWSAHAEYTLQAGSHYRSQSGSLRLMLAF